MYVCKKINILLLAAVAAAVMTAAALGRTAAVSVSLNSGGTADIPVLMYHSIADRPSRAGDYLVLPETFYNDMKYLHDRGYSTVTSAEVYDYAVNGGSLPEKAVVVTFDDGFLNNMTYALPVLEEFNMCGTVNIVGSYSKKSAEADDPNPNYAYLTPEEICTLAESGRFEIGAHTFDMHGFTDRKGCRKNDGETDGEYKAAFSEDCRLENEYLLNECGIVTDIFAYPYGFISEGSSDVLKSFGYKILFTCYERHNYIKPGETAEGDILFLDRYNRPYGLSSEAFMKNAGIE